VTRPHIQYRAICPYCFHEQAVKIGIVNGWSRYLLVDHGYSIPHGWRQGRCVGVEKPHFGTPEGRDFAAKCAAEDREHAKRYREVAGKVRRGEMPCEVWDRTGKTDHRGMPEWGYIVKENPTPYDREQHACRIEHAAATIDLGAARVEAKVAAWTPQEPRRVSVEAKAACLHWSRLTGPVAGKPLCRLSWPRTEMPRAESIEKVTCPRCLSWLRRMAVAEAKKGGATGAWKRATEEA
jgi:hypothetical protein